MRQKTIADADGRSTCDVTTYMRHQLWPIRGAGDGFHNHA
jgi:hypothetical protein